MPSRHNRMFHLVGAHRDEAPATATDFPLAFLIYIKSIAGEDERNRG